MIAAIVEELTIEASPERVWNALTQQDEIACWWTNDLSAKPEVGALPGQPGVLPGDEERHTRVPSLRVGRSLSACMDQVVMNRVLDKECCAIHTGVEHIDRFT